jgi:hypothetical protein
MSKPIYSRSKTAMALLAAVAIPVVAASAAVTIFTFDGTEGVSTYSKTVDGITMTLSDPVESSSVFAFGIINIGPANGDLDLSAPGVLVSSFKFKFDAPVKLVSYSVGVVAGPAAGTFSLSGPAAAISTGNTLASTGSHDFNGNFTLAANAVGTWTANIPSGTYPTIRSITVDTAVPEPGQWALVSGALCVLTAFGIRRLRAKQMA